MADNLIFPVKFDLEAAVRKAQGDADKYLRQLQTTIHSKPLAIDLKIVNAGSGSLNEISKRMRDIVAEWNNMSEAERIASKTSGEYTDRAKKLIAEFARLTGASETYARSLQQIVAASRRAANEQEKNMEKQRKTNAILQAQENTIDNITAKLKHWRGVLNSSELNGQQFRKAADEVRRLSKELETAKSKVDAMTGKAKSVNTLTQEFAKQDGYVSRLVKRLAVYASFSAFQTLLTSIREVTAEFELQRVSLGAIIQDQTRANQLFSEIKAFALKSPLKILDLTKYTKQLAAYRFETDKLFDTTKRLADVSVGLGVDYGRILLAYGQTKSATYLRAAELRQYTESGIPLLELLAEKFSKLEGQMVSTEEVMDKISKRMVTFSMVEDVFKDMTDAGGMFYNMQEKQSQTLYGMWAKMGDAVAVMYEQMGNTATANQGMKDAIQLLSDMMLHWTALANVAQTAAIGFLGYKAAIAGLVPFYALQTKLTVNQIKAEKAKQAQQIKTLAVGRALTREEQLAVASKNKLMAADYKRLLTEGKLSAAQKISLGRQAASNVQLRRAVLELNLFTKAQITALGKMSGWQFFWAKFKLWGQGIGQMFVNLDRTMKAFAPLAAITAVIDLIMDWNQAMDAQNEAVKKVEKQYEETKVTLMQIENAYRDIQNASKAAGESEEEFAKTSYSQKLEQLQKVIKLLGQFGMKNVIDPSVLDYTNIDPVLDKWLAKLNEVNELARGWGREVALVANAYEGNVMGWSIFGENLKEDMKDLERAWTKLTVNSEFSASLEQLRAIVGKLSNDNKQVYENISRAIGADLKLALGQKRRNESELQYQQRIYKNYQNIESYLQTYLKKGDYKGMLPSLSSEDVSGVLSDFQSQVDEVMHEFDKVKEKFRGQDALTVKMAIDTVAAENDWTEWQKELLIQHLNENPITLNAEIIPTTNVAGQGAVAEGLKAIITSEFPTLFNENELQSLVSAEGIVEAIKTKLDASNESLEKSVQLQNNIAYRSKGFENSLKRVKQLQDEITEVENMRAELATLEAIEGDKTEEQLLRQSELQAKLAEVDEASINTKRAQIAAIVEANAKYDEQIKKQRESAEAEREIAKAALDRVSSMGLSDLGKDVKEQFGGLMVDAVKEMTDKNYSTDFLISDEDLKKVRDVADLYDMWAKNTKAIKDEKEKLVGVGITEATIEKERAELEAKRAKIQSDLADLERQMTDEKYAAQVAEYNRLRYALTTAVTQEAQQKAQQDLNKFLGDTQNAEFAILMMKKEGLRTSLQETLVSEQANTQIGNYLKGLEDADKLWEELGKRYNFKLPTNDRGRGGSGEDPWILLMKNRMKFMQDFQKGVEDLSKWMGYTKGLADEQENMLGRGLSLKIDSRKLDGTKEELIKWYEDSIGEIRKRIAKLGGKEWEGLGVQMILAKDTKSRVLKKYQELLADMFKELTDFRTDQTQKALEAKIKELSDRISRTKTAKEFYEKILRLTRNEGLAFQATFSVYGKDTLDTFTDEVEQLKQNFGEIDITAAINLKTKQIDYKKLRDIWDADKSLPDNLRKIPQAYDSAIKSILDAGDKLSERQLERWGKDLERAREYADKRIELAQYTATQIAEIEAKRDSLDPESKNYAAQVAMYNKMISGYREREKNEAAKLDYEQIKEQIGMFDDLGVRIGTAFENILTQLREYTKSPDFARLGLEAQKNVYQQIAKIEDRIAEGFQGIGVGNVSEYVRQYSTAASEYLTAQNNLRDATLRAIEADKEWERVKESNDEAAKTAAWTEKQLADSRVRTAAASVNAAGANLQRAQEGAARASAKFDSNLQRVESSLKSLNNGALKALWDLIGDKGKRSVGEFLSGSKKILSALDKLTKALADSGSDMGQLSTTIATNLAAALQNINPDDTEAIARAATESLKTTLSSVISDKGVVDLLANTLSKNIGEIASQALNGVLSTEDAANKVGALIDGVADAASKTGEMWGAIISLVLSLLDEFAENGIGTFLGELLDNIADAVEGILANLLTDSLPKILGSVGNVIKGVGTGLGDLLTFGVFDLTGAKRIKKANKEIERQQKLLDQLEYTYGRLEKAAERAFGGDYISNYNQRMRVLRAEQEAYLKQAEAERSKGKDEDEAKTQEYMNRARDAADQIAEMQSQIAEQMTGTDVGSAAREFAQAWLEAYASFSSTSSALKEKFDDMIKSMVEESVMAKVVSDAMQPMFDEMNEMYKRGESMTSVLAYAMRRSSELASELDAGLRTAAAEVEAAGVSIRGLYSGGDGLKGISRDIATASEESIMGLAQGVSTQNYYLSHVPQLAQNVAALRAMMEAAAVRGAGTGASGVDYTGLSAEAMGHLAAIERHTAETVAECRNIAARCEEEVELLRRVIVPKGQRGAHGVQVWM